MGRNAMQKKENSFLGNTWFKSGYVRDFNAVFFRVIQNGHTDGGRTSEGFTLFRASQINSTS